jgi:hypothetical protein
MNKHSYLFLIRMMYFYKHNFIEKANKLSLDKVLNIMKMIKIK